MKKILTDAAAVGQAAGRALNWRFADAASRTGPTTRARSGAACCGRAAPSSRRRRRSSRTACSSRCRRPAPARSIRAPPSTTATRSTAPGMIMRIPGVGSQYLMAFLDRRRRAVRRREDLQGDAAQGHPGRGVLVVHALRQPDPLDAADAAEIPARRQPELSLAGRDGGRGRLHHRLVRARRSPTAWSAATGSRPTPKKGWFTILRLYSPLPSFFDKSWRPSEIEVVN